MEKLIVLGTGKAHVTECYNTCFALHNGEECMLVDGGGGSGILAALKRAGIRWKQIHHIFVTHEHIDHLFGVIWAARLIAFEMLEKKYDGDLHIYCGADVSERITAICRMTLQQDMLGMFGSRILIHPVDDGEQRQILHYDITFFDIHSPVAQQYGFRARLPGGRTLTFLGDECCDPACLSYVDGCDWLLSDAYCLESEREKFHPQDMRHSTVKDACELAQRQDVRNLVLWHTEDTHIRERKSLYTAEGRRYFHGNLFVPDDQEVICL